MPTRGADTAALPVPTASLLYAPPVSLRLPPADSQMDPKFLRNQRYAKKHNAVKGKKDA